MVFSTVFATTDLANSTVVTSCDARPLAAAPATEWHEGATGLDLGASQGVDAEMMLRQGLQVLAVEGLDGWRMVEP